MLPHIGPYPVWLVGIALVSLISGMIAYARFGKSVGAIRLAGLVVSIAVAGVVGSRIFHVLWERPEYFRANPWEAFTRLDGMVFYGAFAGGLLAFLFLYKRVFKSVEDRFDVWDIGSICLALGVGVLRLACFAEGCCWGSPTAMPWAVRFFHPKTVMPWIGIPVHPTQLYDSFVGFAMAGLFTWAFLKTGSFDTQRSPVKLSSAPALAQLLRGRFVYFFGILYGAARFTTEFFRGDTIRGVDVVFSLSTSQIISVVLFAVSALLLLRSLRSAASLGENFTTASKKLSPQLALGVLMALGLSGCFLPKPPTIDTVKKTTLLAPGVELHRMNKEQFVFKVGEPDPVREDVLSGRNLIWVATDDEVQPLFQKQLMDAYKSETPIRLEDITWWMHASKVRKLYDHVIRIRYDQFTREALWTALKHAETLGKPYDLFLLTHGVPNHIVTSKGFPLISWKDLGELKGKLQHLDLIFNQACFGDSLVPDWHAAGARTIIHFREFNRNFFYLGFFLDDYRKEKVDAIAAFDRTNARIDEDLGKSRLYRKVIEALGLTMEEYLQQAYPPEISAP
jgi:phosphatidylglycerol:prolipoprotein diacylglycerol transferase